VFFPCQSAVVASKACYSGEDSRWSKYGGDDAEGRAEEIPQDTDCLGMLFLVLLFVSSTAFFQL